MAKYYFDIETTGIDFDEDEIITIQWQRLEPLGELNILKSWESSEKEILEDFSPNLTCFPWDFIFVGKNMLFDFNMLSQRMKHHNLGEFDLRCLNERVTLDIKPILIFINNGTFKGYHELIPKTNPTKNNEIPELYKEGNFAEIIQYVENEAQDFIKVYQTLKEKMPLLSKHL